MEQKDLPQNGDRALREPYAKLQSAQCGVVELLPLYLADPSDKLRPKEEAATEEFLRSLEYYHLTWPVPRMVGLLKRDLARKGTTVTVADATIAAVALAHELTLM